MTATDTPAVSVIVPVYNDPNGIETTLESLCEQTHPESDYELVIVDNGSTDSTRAVAREFRDRNPETVRLLVEDDRQGSYAARNLGIERSTGRIVAFLDADMWVDETWVESVIDAVDTSDCDYLGCDVEIRTESGGETPVATYNRLTGFPVEGYVRNQSFAPTCCLVVRRRVFESVGRFDARMTSGGDAEFGRRVHDAGFEQCFDPTITVYHPARSSLRSLLSKRFRVGRGLVQFSRYHADRFDVPVWRRPGDYLPPHPIRFRHRMRRASASLPPGLLVLLYLVAYVDTVARTAGAWYEHLFGVDESALFPDPS